MELDKDNLDKNELIRIIEILSKSIKSLSLYNVTTTDLLLLRNRY